MLTHRIQWKPATGWSTPLAELPPAADLVLYFGATELLAQPEGPLADLRRHTLAPIVAGCSTAGEIFGTEISEQTLSVISVKFDMASVQAVLGSVPGADESGPVGAKLGRQLSSPDLRHVLVLSDGLHVNGTPLTEGLRSTLPEHVSVSGGLAGDGLLFGKTLVGLGDRIASDQVVAIGFYGDSLNIGGGLSGGWSPFGPHRRITRSEGNILYSLDDQPALALYKRYLGDRAAGLPGTGFLFPLQILSGLTGEEGLVRTLLAIDESTQSLTFAGDIPQGNYARLMKSSCDALIDSTEIAGAQASATDHASESPALAIIVSCVGRRIVLGQRCEEEIELASRQLPVGTEIAGFYSYGEISPSGHLRRCDLHNQTLVMTLISEAS